MTSYSFLIRPIVSYLILFYHAERALIPTLAKKLYNKSYFEAARSLGKRSMLDVCEHSPNEADAERALLYSFFSG